MRQINQERQRNGLGALVVNKPLLLAALDHANFIAGINRLSHTQPTKAKERARQRLEHYGGKMQGLGENTAFIGIGSRMIYQGRNGTRDTVTITTYEGIAEYMINAWLNSNGHKANMLNSEFVYTGISAALNSDKPRCSRYRFLVKAIKCKRYSKHDCLSSSGTLQLNMSRRFVLPCGE